MNATTGNLPKVQLKDASRELKRGPVIVFVLVIVFTILGFLGDRIHQALDPSYRKEVEEFERQQEQFDDSLKKFDTEESSSHEKHK